MYSKLLKLNRTSLRKIYRSFYTEIFTSQLPLDKKFLLAAEPKKMRIKLYLSTIFNIKCGIFCSHMIILLLFEFVLSKHCLIWSSKYCILSIIFFFIIVNGLCIKIKFRIFPIYSQNMKRKGLLECNKTNHFFIRLIKNWKEKIE